VEALTFEITDEDCFGDPFYVIKFNFGTMYENKVSFWKRQCKRYGAETMLDWHNRVPYKVKERAYQ